VSAKKCHDDLWSVHLTVDGPTPPPLEETPEPHTSYSSLFVRIDEERHEGVGDIDSVKGYLKALDRKASWVPMRQGGQELVEIPYDPELRKWITTVDVRAKCGTRYSLYLEEREPITLDQAEVRECPNEFTWSERIVYCDRLLLNIHTWGI
jgi:hypothetical protein